MKKAGILFAILLFFCCCQSGEEKPDTQVSYFDMQDVRLLPSPFKHAEDLDIKYLQELDADRLLAPYLREAGLPQKAESYANWENTGLDGHIGGHYVSALSLMYGSTGNDSIKQRLDYMLSEWKRCQDANGDGYIGGVPEGKQVWDEIEQGNIRAGNFDLNGKWVPLYNIHKVFAGLRDAYLYAGSEEAKEMLIKMTDWVINLTSNLSDEQMQDMLRSEHGGLNEVFADVAAITGENKYLQLAHRFSHQLVLEPLLNKEDKLTGMHANTQIPKVLGYKRIADLEENKAWSDASEFFWQTVVNNRSIVLGGNSAYEHFHPSDDFSRMIKAEQGPETCNTYNMLRLTKMLYQTSPDKSYIDYYERALYNHILSTIHPEQGGFVYFTQMRPSHYRVYSQPHTSFWCCVGSGLENHAKYGEMIYAHNGDNLYVNLFIPSVLIWKDKGVKITQENKFPEKAQTALTIDPDYPTSFTLKIRNPQWVDKSGLTVKVNGKPISIKKDNDYISIDRKWNVGDRVEVDMPMYLYTEQLKDNSNYYSFLYGPIVLAAKTGREDLQGLFADDSRGGHIAHGKIIPMKDIPILVRDPKELTSLIQPKAEEPLSFVLSNLYAGKEKLNMQLIPFYKLHEDRYIIYFPQATEGELKEIQQKAEDEEKETIRLDALSIDKVSCGEQQPESDHFVKMGDSWTGFTEDQHWREARGWFSYQLRNNKKEAKKLFIRLLDIDKGRKLDLFINDIKLQSLDFEGKDGNTVFTFDIPDSEKQKPILNIKFMGRDKAITPKILEVRLLKE